MPTTTAYSRGTVVLVRFPFTDLRGSKQRPALVLSSEAFHRTGEDTIVAAISSGGVDEPRRFDHVLENWRGSGLLHPSVVRAGKLVTLDRSMIRLALGTIGPDELERVERLLREALGFSDRQ